MDTKQINLKLPKNLAEAAKRYARNFGFRNIQELAAASMREKIFEKEVSESIFVDEELLAENWLSKEDNEAWKDL